MEHAAIKFHLVWSPQSPQEDQCVMCTVPGLAPATNYTVSVTALSDAGTGAGSEEIEQMTDLGEL